MHGCHLMWWLSFSVRRGNWNEKNKKKKSKTDSLFLKGPILRSNNKIKSQHNKAHSTFRVKIVWDGTINCELDDKLKSIVASDMCKLNNVERHDLWFPPIWHVLRTTTYLYFTINLFYYHLCFTSFTSCCLRLCLHDLNRRVCIEGF